MKIRLQLKAEVEYDVEDLQDVNQLLNKLGGAIQYDFENGYLVGDLDAYSTSLSASTNVHPDDLFAVVNRGGDTI